VNPDPTSSSSPSPETLAELARLGSATVYEAGGRRGYVDLDLHQTIPGSRAAGPARTVRCAQSDNLMVHAVMAAVQPGEIIVITQPEPRPVAMVGDLLATQAEVRGAAGMLIDASVRDREDLAQMAIPIWARWIRIKGAEKSTVGQLGEPVTVGGAVIRPGDILVLDTDGVAVVEAERVVEVLALSLEREERERVKRGRLRDGALSWEIDGLRGTFAPGRRL
jgi:4-hydroxy-4-methyl-2-oxoglutarate aldolase